MKERLFPAERHPSMRGYFAAELYEQMAKNEDIWLICYDLGYKVFDFHFRDFPKRTLNVGASEQAGTGIAIGLALRGKIPFCYSITSFLLGRPFEFLRNYTREDIAIKLAGSGRDQDYSHDGWTHDVTDAKKILEALPHIVQFCPETKEEVPGVVEKMIKNNKPSFISLKR